MEIMNYVWIMYTVQEWRSYANYPRVWELGVNKNKRDAAGDTRLVVTLKVKNYCKFTILFLGYPNLQKNTHKKGSVTKSLSLL